MKKVIIGILLFYVCSIDAQSVHMLEGAPFWVYCNVMVSDHYHIDSHYFYRIGDTEEINGKIYYKLYYDRDYMESRAIEPVTINIREDNGRILVNYEAYMAFLKDHPQGDPDYIPYKLTDDGEMILYDFNMQVGDKYNSVSGHEDISVTNIEMITTKDRVERKLFTLSNGLKIIEGIGCISSRGWLLSYLNPTYFPDYLPWSYFTFISNFEVFGEQIYGQVIDDFVGIEHITVDKTNEVSFPLYDLSGRKITGNPEQGIYIRNRKKVWIE